MKKWYIRAVCVALLLGNLVACSSAGNVVSSKNPGETVKPQNKEVTIRFSFWGDDERKRKFEAIISKFNQKYPHIHVEMLMIPNAEYAQKVAIMVASKTAPDVAWLSQTTVKSYVEGNQLLDISSLKTDPDFNYDDIFPTSLNLYQKDGKLYGIPFSSAPRPIFFNKTLFKEKGVKTPLEQVKEGKWTYDDYLNTAKALTDTNKGIYGGSLIVALGWKAWQQSYMDTIWAFGGKLLSDDGTKFLLNSPEGGKALQFISDMMFKDKVHPKPGDQLAFSFETGKLAMSRQDYSYVNNARKIKDFEWDIAPMPTGIPNTASAVGNSGYAVLADTKYPQEAIAFLKFMTDKQGTQLVADQFVAPRKSFLQSDAFQKANTIPSAEGIKAALIDVFDKGVKIEYSHKNWAKIDLKMQVLFDSLYMMENPKTVLQKMEEEITPLLK